MRDLALAVSILLFAACVRERPIIVSAKDSPPGAWVTQYYWETMMLNKETPLSEDGRYRLKTVRENGDVEILYSEEPGEAELIVAKTMPKKLVRGARPPTIVVEESDYARQSAKIRALRAK
jgi:hypothetical protein